MQPTRIPGLASVVHRLLKVGIHRNEDDSAGCFAREVVLMTS